MLFFTSIIQKSLILRSLLVVFCLLILPAFKFSQPDQKFIRSFQKAHIQKPQSYKFLKRNTEESFIESLSYKERNEFIKYVNQITRIIRQRNPKFQKGSSLAYQITRESYLAQVDPLFATAVIAAESNFNSRAVSHMGAIGLMQIMPGTGAFLAEELMLEWSGKNSLFNVNTNLKMGLHYLKYLFLNHGRNLDSVLVAYNWGPGNLRYMKRGFKTPPLETNRYRRKVKELYSGWISERRQGLGC